MSSRLLRLTKKLELKGYKLNALLEITQAINKNLDVEELLDLYRNVLVNRLGIEKVILFAEEMGNWTCILKVGVAGEIRDIKDESFFNQSESISLNLTSGGQTESFDVVIPVHHDEVPLAYLMVGDLGEDEIRMSPVIKHMKFIQTLTNIIIVAIRNKKFIEQSLVQERINKELELAAEMQSLLLPKEFPEHEAYKVSAVYKPHQQVGGDYYDFLQLNDEEIMMCMADVSGKGVSAAFLMSNFQANLRALFSYRQPNMLELIQELNERVMSSARGEKFITFFVCIYNLKTRKLKYVNCGHNPPVLTDESGDIELLSLGTYGLGMFDEIPQVNLGEITVKPNSTVMCYTDGLVEMENDNREEYGMKRLINILRKAHELSPLDLNKKIMREIDDFRESQPYFDDTAILSCRIF
ncbi:PP2C family protein-serine/threonine phosphatase [Halocola ammonii]